MEETETVTLVESGSRSREEFNGKSLWKIRERHSIFSDAAVHEDGDIVFIRVWGSDASLNGLMGAIQLSSQEGGIDSLHLDPVDGNSSDDGEDKLVLEIGDPRKLKKHTGRIAAAEAPLFERLAWLWIYPNTVLEPDLANRIMYFIDTPEELSGDRVKEKVWSSIKYMSKIAILDEWREPIMEGRLFDAPFIETLPNLGGVIGGIKLQIPDDFEKTIVEKGIRGTGRGKNKRGVLSLPD